MEDTSTFKSIVTNNKTTIIRILIFVVISVIIYLIARLKFTLDDIKKNWHDYKCKYPYSMFGGYLAPDGIRDKEGNVHTGMYGSKLHYTECNKLLHTAITGAALAPLYASKGADIGRLKKERKKLSYLAQYSTRIRDIIGSVFKKMFKFLLVIYYIIVYCFEKIKQILFKVQGVIDVILDTFKIFLRFVNYLLFDIIPAFLNWQVSMFTISLAYTLFSAMVGAGGATLSVGSTVAGILSLLASGSAVAAGGVGAAASAVGATGLASGAASAGAAASGAASALSLGPVMAVLVPLAAVAAGTVFYLFLWILGQSKDFITDNTQFAGIGDIDMIPFLEGKSYDYIFDPLSAQSKDPSINKHANSAGSILNILSIITLALGREHKNDTSSCFTKNTLVKLKKCSVTIQQCSPGTTLNNGGIILGVMIYKPQLVDIYDYKGVTMTGSHYIYENKNNLIACKDIGLLIGKSYEELYCPITSNGKLQLLGVNNTIDVADYNDGKTFSEWNYITDNDLNRSMNYTKSDYEEHNYAPLFVDKDITEKECLGSIKYLSTDNIKLYDYNGIIVSGNVLVIENGLWKRIWQTNAKHVENNYKYLYNIVTDNHNIKYKNILFKDFEETNI